jgi:hypothetical protein
MFQSVKFAITLMMIVGKKIKTLYLNGNRLSPFGKTRDTPNSEVKVKAVAACVIRLISVRKGESGKA